MKFLTDSAVHEFHRSICLVVIALNSSATFVAHLDKPSRSRSGLFGWAFWLQAADVVQSKILGYLIQGVT